MGKTVGRKRARHAPRKSRKVTYIALGVTTKDGLLYGTPWMTQPNALRKAKNFVKRALKRDGKQVKSVTKHIWREGDTLKTYKKKTMKSL